MVEKHIKTLLYDHDCVIIPDFGGLIARYVSARIHPVKHSLLPPSKKIAFNEKLTLNDGLLISTIAYQKGISKEEAQRQVTDFVSQAKAKLHHEKRFELHEIGVFRYTTEHRLEFEYIESDNLLNDSFGLPDLVARPLKLENPALLRTLLKERETVPVQHKSPFRKRLKKVTNIVAGLALTSLSISALYLLSLQTDYNLSSLSPISLFGNTIYLGDTKAAAPRYAHDYVPYTADERVAAYTKLLPDQEEVTLIDDTEVAVPEAVIVDSAFVAGVLTESVAVAEAPAETVSELVKEKVEEVKPVEKEPEPTIIKNRTGRFYIIAGGYSNMENAEVARKAATKKGQEAKVLTPLPGSRLFRVSVADFDSKEEAHAALDGLRKSFGETIWVHNN